MEITRFDALARSVAVPASRRSALRLLLAGPFGGVLPVNALRAAQPFDRDFDGLLDDDEAYVLKTNPVEFDSDADGIGDGDELALGLDPLTANDPSVDLTTCRSRPTGR